MYFAWASFRNALTTYCKNKEVCIIFAMSYEPVREKTNYFGSDQVRHKPGCTVTEDG